MNLSNEWSCLLQDMLHLPMPKWQCYFHVCTSVALSIVLQNVYLAIWTLRLRHKAGYSLQHNSNKVLTQFPRSDYWMLALDSVFIGTDQKLSSTGVFWEIDPVLMLNSDMTYAQYPST